MADYTMWIAIFACILLVLILGIYYLYTRTRKIFSKREDLATLPKEKKRRISLLSAVPVAVIILLCVIDPYIFVVPVLHLGMFWVIFELIIQIVEFFLNRKSRKEGAETSEEVRNDGQPPIPAKALRDAHPVRRAPFWLNGVLALFVTTVYMLVAYYLAVHVYKTEYTVKTGKDVSPLRVALIADSHIGTCFDGHGFSKHIKTIEAQQPDVLLICGDFVDDDTERRDMVLSCKALGEMETTYGVYYVPGNHDKGYGDSRDFTYEELLSELRENGVTVLEDDAALVAGQYYIVGRNDRSMSRQPIDTLVRFIDPKYYTIVLDHQPNDYDAEEAANCDLVLSGHTHGGQMIPIQAVGELIGANDATYGREVRGNTTFIVTSGIADWAIPYKSGTISEYVIIDIEPD